MGTENRLSIAVRNHLDLDQLALGLQPIAGALHEPLRERVHLAQWQKIQVELARIIDAVLVGAARLAVRQIQPQVMAHPIKYLCLGIEGRRQGVTPILPFVVERLNFLASGDNIEYL